MQEAYEKKRSRAGGTSAAKLMAPGSDASLLGKLWNLDCGVGNPGAIKLDDDLMTAEWADKDRAEPPAVAAEHVSCPTP